MEGQCEQQTRRCHRHQKPGNAAAHRQEHAFRESLGNNLPPRGANGHAYGGLAATRHRASQQQVRDIGAGNQQHQAADGEQDLQAAPVLFLHLGDAGAGGDNIDHLLGKHSDHVRHPVGGISGIILHPLPQHSGEARSHSVNRSSRPQAADHAQPGSDGLVQQCAFTVNQGLLVHGNPDIGRVTAQRFAEKSGRSHANHGKRMALHDEG